MIGLPLLLAAAHPLPVAQAVPTQARRGAPPVEIWHVDQIRVPLTTPKAVLAALEPDHTLDAVAKRLTDMGVRFTRGRVAMLPDRLPADVRAQIASSPPSEPFVLPERGFIGIDVIIGRRLPSDMVQAGPSPSRQKA